MNNLISAKVVADSVNEWGDRITTMEVVMPRIILAEFNTHRMFSRNSASSRAIPFKRMLEMIEENPFVPIAWQKEHKGMQGNEYHTDKDRIEEIVNFWLAARDNAVNMASILTDENTTKQLANRLLEPFMYHKVLVTSTEWENFFELRSPQYVIPIDAEGTIYRTKKDLTKAIANRHFDFKVNDLSTIEWLQINKGAAEIHMMDLAEKMWDALNESKPRELKAGEWHIPYRDHIDDEKLYYDVIKSKFPASEYSHGEKDYLFDEALLKVSTGMAARVSYTTIGDEKEVKYETLIGIYDKMAKARPFHASPFEHCSQAMSEKNLEEFGKVLPAKDTKTIGFIDEGWCRNFKGFIQLRHILETDRNDKSI